MNYYRVENILNKKDFSLKEKLEIEMKLLEI